MMAHLEGGQGPRGPFVSLVCDLDGEGITYWDKEVHGWPTIQQVATASAEHTIAHHYHGGLLRLEGGKDVDPGSH